MNATTKDDESVSLCGTTDEWLIGPRRTNQSNRCRSGGAPQIKTRTLCSTEKTYKHTERDMFVFDEYSQRLFAFRFRNGSFNCGAAKVERISGGLFLIGPQDGVDWGQLLSMANRRALRVPVGREATTAESGGEQRISAIQSQSETRRTKQTTVVWPS